MRGDIVLVDFPFSDGGGAKVRPALVVQDDAVRSVNTIIAQITSNVARTGATRLLIDPATEPSSGLRATSIIVCQLLYSVHGSRILRVIGSLSAATMTRVDGCLRAALGL